MKNKGKFARYGGIIFVILFVAATFVINTGILYPKYETHLDTTGFPVVYSKDNTLYIAPLEKETNSLSDFLTVKENTSPEVSIADSGNAVYFFENYDDETKTGSLFVTYDGREKIPVSGKAFRTICLSTDGKSVLYAENPDLDAEVSKLYMYEKGGEKILISDSAQLYYFFMDADTGNVFYVESGDLYIKDGKNPEKIDSDTDYILCVPDGSSVVYKKKSGELYFWKKSKQPEKLSDSASKVMAQSVHPENFIWYSKSDDTGADLFVYDGAPVKLDENVMNIYECDPARASVLYTKNFNPETFDYDVSLIYKGGKPEKLTSSKDGYVYATSSTDFKKTAYIENDKLYIREHGMLAEEEPVLIAENVETYKMSQNGESIAYVSGDKLYLKYKDKLGEVASEVEEYHFTPDGDTLCYMANYNEAKRSGNLYIRNAQKPQAESLKVDSDVMRTYYARNGRNIIYIRKYNNETGEGELCVFRKGEIHTIDSGNVKILCEKY